LAAALREQKSMKLPWYMNIKPLLKLNNLYSLDHVSAFKITQPKHATTRFFSERGGLGPP
jgi:hypothetical protein